MKKLPIVFACDENYALPFAVALESLLANKNKDSFYDVYCLVPGEFSEETKQRFDMLRQRCDNFDLSFVNLSGAFSNVEMFIEHISFVTYYRFKIPSILKKYDKALYLDVDMIITSDLSALFEIDLSDSYVGAVKHPTLLHREKVKGYTIPKNSYFNAGMLLLNLDLIRKDKKDEELISLMPENFPIQDQDILNIVFKEKVKYLDLRYNMMTRLCGRFEESLAFATYGENFAIAKIRPVIIHYASKEKPWEFSNLAYNNIWDNYYKLSVFSDVIDLNSRSHINYTINGFKGFISWVKRFVLKIRNELGE